ncbi:MAG: extracellular solute-binding protein [Pseudomonadota bacterium]|nr:extracellular solute-binding protein [Pseudomonadota bacterium]
MMDGIFNKFLHELFDTFFNPQKRVFIGYLGITLVFILSFQLIFTKLHFFSALKKVFAKRIWLSKSAQTDYKILLINKFLMLFASPILLSKLVLATFLFESLHIWFDGRTTFLPSASTIQISTLFTITLFLLDDLTKYLVHRALHNWSILWAFHKVHHTAETLTPLTVFRTHPIEAIIFSLRSTIVQAVTIAGFLYFFGARAELLTILGASIFLFIFNAAGSNLRHSHVWISYGNFFELFFISPAQHQLHHSSNKRHIDCNFGTVLAIWDRIGKTLLCSAGEEGVRFGMGEKNANKQDLSSIYILPFKDAANSIMNIKIKEINIMHCFFKKIQKQNPISICLILSISMVAFTSASAASQLNIYSHRQPFLINPFLEAYKNKNPDLKINIIYSSKGLAQRLKAEGKRSPADVILTVDMARLNVFADKNLLQPIESKILENNVPKHLRDIKNRWFALSKRARIIIVSDRAKDAKEILRYEDLADSKWKGRICARPGSHVYNRALIASFIHHFDEKIAEIWATKMVNNLARRPQGNDRAQVKAIFEGQCDIAVINNYYLGKLKSSKIPEQRLWANSVKPIFPNQSDRGTHVNISGGGIAKFAKNKEEAIKFLEFLTSKEAQVLYGKINYEYPINPKISKSEELQSWGDFKEDQMPISRISDLAPEAQKVIDRARW